jgi:hypothetical protein
MIPMPQPFPAPEDDFTQLTQLAQRFAHWRQNRPSPKARIPQELWDDAVSLALNSRLSASRVAKRLGLCTSDLKKRYPDSAAASAKRQCEPFVSFVDVTPTTPWLTLAVEVDLKRTDGAHLHLTYHQGMPELRELVRTFLERDSCSNSVPKAGSSLPPSPLTFEKESMGSPLCVAKAWVTTRSKAPSMSFAIAPPRP